MYGQDVRKHIPLLPIEVYTRAVCDAAVRFIGPILRNSETFKLPLAYPHPDEQFYVYDHKRIPRWYPETVKTGTKELVARVRIMSHEVV